ncbi:MAG: AAA family ATPase [Planctomycetota bacterium]
MSGLPATGKDHWIAEHAADWPVVSLDTIRNDLGISPGDNQGAVVATAKEKARGHLRRSEPFVWNATNTTRPMRAQLVSLFHQYRARIRIVYAETCWEELLRLMYEESIRVPTIIRDPRLRSELRGRRSSDMALSIDLAPTMLALAGVPVPESMQGREVRFGVVFNGGAERPGRPILQVNLLGTEVTDAHLVHLKGLTSLRELYFNNTQVTDAGVNELKKALPNCRIHH